MTRKSLWLVLCSAILLFAACQKAPVLTVTGPTNIELSADGSSGTITFTANRDWTISTSDSWVSVSPSRGEATDGQVTVSVRCGSNTTYEDRTATVTIRMEELTQTVSVRQPANLGIVLPTQSYNLESDARTIDVEVQANVQYTVSTSVNWIKQTGTKGLTTTKYTFSIEENTTYDSREGAITIKSQNSSVPDQVITVKQAQKDALIIKDKSFDMPYGGGEIEFKVEANVDFDVKPDVDWIHYLETKALSNSTVRLSVDENPTYAAREGKIEIKQKNGSLSHTITVKEAGRIAVTSISLDQTSIKLKEDETATLVATVKPDNATDKAVTWSSSNDAIATVDETGKVTAIKEGTATITAKAGEKTAECKVTVYVAVTSVELNKTTLSLIEGESETLTATVKPDKATDKTVTWSSSDEKIATVKDGKITAVKVGEATIIAKAGDKTAECKVTVRPVPVASITLDQTTLELEVGQKATLVATVNPDNAADKTVKWSTSDAKTASVDASGEVIGVAEGTATITAQAGDKTAECKVTVIRIPVTNITLDKASLDLIKGETVTLTATIAPDNATNKEVKWESSDKETVSVDETGKVIANKAGTATITASIEGYSATCSVEVFSDVLEAVDMGLSVKWANMNIGASAPFENGKYFAWGEVETKNEYTRETYKWYNTNDGYTKYGVDANWWDGVCDDKVTLELQDDAANYYLGDNWRMPTHDEIWELRDQNTNCTWEKTEIRGITVYKVVSKINGNSIIIPFSGFYSPAAGFCNEGTAMNYWSSSLYEADPKRAWYLGLEATGNNKQPTARAIERVNGFPIRPVTE